MTRRYGEGAIDQRGPDAWRLRYRIGGKRFALTVHGTKAHAQRELRRLLREGDTGEHVAPDRITVAAWSTEWLALIRRGQVSARSWERYAAVVATHILPKLGGRPLQQLRVGEIDALYRELDGRPTLVRYVHTVLRLMLGGAVRKGLLQKNPAANATIPRARETTVGRALEPAELRRLLDGLRNSAVFPLVLCAATTGIRLGEALTLQWSDLNIQAKTLSISRTIEETRAHGRRTKPPKSARGRRVIAIDDALLSVLLAERERYQRLAAGVPDGAGDVDLSLVRLPPAALIFPTLASGEFEPTRLRSLKGTSRQLRNCFKRLGFKMRVHDLRTTHATMLLNAGVPVHTAAARLGHSPVMLLKVYAKQTKQADADAADAVAKLMKGAGT